jgi:hypothetical protein
MTSVICDGKKVTPDPYFPFLGSRVLYTLGGMARVHHFRKEQLARVWRMESQPSEEV